MRWRQCAGGDDLRALVKDISKTICISALVFITGFGFLLRSYKLGEQSLWIDEIYTLNGAQSVLKHGYPLLDSGSLYTNGPLVVYMTALSIKVFGLDPFSPVPERAVSAVAGTIAILFFAFFVHKIYKRKDAAIIAAFLFAFSFFEISWARQVRGYALCLAFLFLAFGLAWSFRNTRKKFVAFVAIASLGFAALSHYAALAFVPSIAVLLYEGFLLKKFPEIELTSLRARLFLIAAIFILIGILVGGTSGFAHLFLYFLSVPYVAAFLLGGAIAFAILWHKSDARPDALFLLLSILTSFALLALFSPSGEIRYVVFLLPFSMVLISGCIVHISNLACGRILRTRFLFSLALCVLLYGPFLDFYPHAYHELEPDTPQADFTQVAKIIRDTRSPHDVIVSAHPVFSKLYFGEKSYWLAIRIGVENKERFESGAKTDYYTDSPAVRTIRELGEILDRKHGFVIVDAPVILHADERLLAVTKHPKVSLAYYSPGNKAGDEIWVYRF